MTEKLPLADELAAVFARMSGLVLSDQTVETALGLVTNLAVEVLPGTAGAGVSLIDSAGTRVTAAATSPLVEGADALQYQIGEGPCLAAWALGSTVRVDDLSIDERWPRWTAAVRETGLRSCLSAPLVAGNITVGALKVYSSSVGAYEEQSEHVLRMFAAQAAILVVNVQSVQAARELSEDLKGAMRGRDIISIAKGILMSREQVTEEDAFAMLVALARRDGRGLRKAADDLVRSAPRRRR